MNFTNTNVMEFTVIKYGCGATKPVWCNYLTHAPQLESPCDKQRPQVLRLRLRTAKQTKRQLISQMSIPR